MKYDIIVVGGGFAGVGAAVAAAREGCRVLIIEQSGSLGGAASNCLVLPFMPYYTKVKKPDGSSERLDLVQGIFKEICGRLEALGQLSGNTFGGDYLKVVLDRITAEAGVDVLFHSAVTEVLKDGKRLYGVVFSTVAGSMTAEADCFVDATGDANLSFLADCRFQLGREGDNLCQPMTLCFRVANVCRDEVEEEREEMQRLYKQYRAEGKIKNPREDILLFRMIAKNMIHFNATRVVRLNPTDPFELSRAETEAREQMVELVDFLKTNLHSFRNAEIVASASSIGVRESRMVLGEHILTGSELVEMKKFEDSVAAGNYDIDIHNPEGSGTSHYFFPDGGYYTIPYRSLAVKDADNLLAAGRCISCDHEAQASIRIMPICCATGQAAGTAAAAAFKSGCAVRDADISEIRKTLKRNGAFI